MSQKERIISADIALYPLDPDYERPIVDFIADLRACEGVEVMTHAMSTQIRGSFSAVTGAVNQCMARAMEAPQKMVFVSRYLNMDLNITERPELG